MSRIPGWLVLTGSIAAFAALCWDAGRRLPESYPSVARCQRDPLRYDGREVWIIPAKVISSDLENYEVMHGGGNIRVRSTSQPPVGAYVYVHGTYRAAGWVDQKSILIDEHFIAERNGVVGISLVILLVFAGIFRRAFIWREGSFHVRAPHSAVAPQEPKDRN